MKSFSLIGLVRGLAVALAVFFAASALFSFISLNLDDPEKYLSLFAGIVLAIAVFLGAWAASKESALTGLALGALLLLAHRIIGAAFAETGDLSWIKMVIIILSAVAGSMVHKKKGTSVSSDRRRKSIRKRYGAY